MKRNSILSQVFPENLWIEPHEFVFDSGKTKLTQQISKFAPPFRIVGKEDKFPNKPLVESAGQAVYPEFAVLRLLEDHGFRGVWVDCFRRNTLWKAMSHECRLGELSETARFAYEKIVTANNGRTAGCWDVLASNGQEVVFIECKANTAKYRDKINRNQVLWLEAAVIRAKFDPLCFAVCEWIEG